MSEEEPVSYLDWKLSFKLNKEESESLLKQMKEVKYDPELAKLYSTYSNDIKDED